jgi:APA family basic amino acid/polyamine antiporter
VAGIVLLGTFLVVHLWKDLTADVGAWYLRSTPLWMIVMALATCIYIRELHALKRGGVDTEVLFRTLPPE